MAAISDEVRFFQARGFNKKDVKKTIAIADNGPFGGSSVK